MAPFIPNVPIPTPLSSPPQPKRLSGICQVVWFHDGAFVIKGLLGGQKYLTLSLEVLANFPNCPPPPATPSLHGLFPATSLYSIFVSGSARSRFLNVARVSRTKDLAQSVNAAWSSVGGSEFDFQM